MHANQPPGRKATLAVAFVAGVIVVALIAALVVWAVSDGSENESPSDQSASEQQQTSPSGEPPSADADGTSDGPSSADALGRPVTVVDSPAGRPLPQVQDPGGFPEQREPVGAPSGLTIQRVGSGVSILVSESDGPTDTDGSVLTGYARSARGAGLLAVDRAARATSIGPDRNEFFDYYKSPVMEGQVPEPESDPARLEQAKEYFSDGYLVPQALKFQSCDENFCTVDVAFPSLREAVGEIATDEDLDAHSVQRTSMKWEGDRWQIVSAGPRPGSDYDAEGWEKWS